MKKKNESQNSKIQLWIHKLNDFVLICYFEDNIIWNWFVLELGIQSSGLDTKDILWVWKYEMYQMYLKKMLVGNKIVIKI